MRPQSSCTDGEHSSVVEPRIVVPVVVGSIPTAHPRKKGHPSQEGCPFLSDVGNRSHDKRRLSWARTCGACPRPFARETPLAGQSAEQTEGGGPGGGSPLLTLEKKGTLHKKGALFYQTWGIEATTSGGCRGRGHAVHVLAPSPARHLSRGSLRSRPKGAAPEGDPHCSPL